MKVLYQRSQVQKVYKRVRLHLIDVYRITDYKIPWWVSLSACYCLWWVSFLSVWKKCSCTVIFIQNFRPDMQINMPATIRFILYQTKALERQYPEAQREETENHGGFLRRIHKVITMMMARGRKLSIRLCRLIWKRYRFSYLFSREQQKLPLRKRLDILRLRIM